MSSLKDNILTALKEVCDPEIPVNVVDLGLIYEVTEFPINNIHIQMTVTSEHCPAAIFLPTQIKEVAEIVSGVNDVHVELVYHPAWNRDRMSADAKKILGYR
jgi:metal-sulfur cluster biosynthetic enzyme